MTAQEEAALVADLVAIDSVNPALVPGGAGESQVAEYVAHWLADHGLEVEVVEPEPGRPSVLGAAGDGRTLMLNGHFDTVGVDGMDRPHEPRIDGDRLYGRGAVDMKGGLAAAMLAAADLAREDWGGRVVLAAVADEEHHSLGTRAVLERVRPDAAVVTEPTDLAIGIAHKGFVWATVRTDGVAAHGSRRDLGVDAIARMGGVLTRLAQLDADLAAGEPHPLLGTGSIHASIISGGREQSTYPDACELLLERRTLPDEPVRAELEALADGVDGDPSVEITFERPPLATDGEEPLVRALAAAASAEGLDATLRGEPFWTDAALIAAAGTPTVLFGPGGEGPHAVVEWVSLTQVAQCRRALVGLARRLGTP